MNNFEIKVNTWNICIGIGPKNINNETNFYTKSWNFVCGKSCIYAKNKYIYSNDGKKTLQKGDIVKVIVDRKLGKLSFEVNNNNIGLSCSEIPKDEILYPIVLINDMNQMVELL